MAGIQKGICQKVQVVYEDLSGNAIAGQNKQLALWQSNFLGSSISGAKLPVTFYSNTSCSHVASFVTLSFNASPRDLYVSLPTDATSIDLIVDPAFPGASNASHLSYDGWGGGL